MKLRVLGCSGGKYKNFNPTCFLLDEKILIDVGNVMGQLELEEMVSLKSILLTHMHFDHIADLPFLIQTLFEEKKDDFYIYSTSKTKKDVFDNIFNNKIWPNLFDLSDKLNWKQVAQYKPFKFENYEITFIPVNHTVPTCGLIIEKNNRSFAFTSDTYITDKFWEECNKKENLKAVIIDVSFPNGFEEKAKLTKHLTTTLLQDELIKLKNTRMDIYVTHIKPTDRLEVVKNVNEITTMRRFKSIAVLEADMIVKI